jgi:hypothetical protein
MRRSGIRLFFVVGALLLGMPAALPAPLDKASCEKLKAEQGQLEQAGTRGNMAKGPEWGKINLAPDKLDQIRRLIEVDGQVLFRCSGRPLVELPKEVEVDPAAAGAKEDGEAPAAKAAKAAPPAKKKAGAREKADPAASEDAKKASATDKKAPAKRTKAAEPAAAEAAKPKPKVKAKSDDAYKPPSSDAGVNPFVNQLAPSEKN